MEVNLCHPVVWPDSGPLRDAYIARGHIEGKPVYAGSVKRPCTTCGQECWIGPRQMEMKHMAAIVCFECFAKTQHPERTRLISLGNPEPATKEPGMTNLNPDVYIKAIRHIMTIALVATHPEDNVAVPPLEAEANRALVEIVNRLGEERDNTIVDNRGFGEILRAAMLWCEVRLDNYKITKDRENVRESN